MVGRTSTDWDIGGEDDGTLRAILGQELFGLVSSIKHPRHYSGRRTA